MSAARTSLRLAAGLLVAALTAARAAAQSADDEPLFRPVQFDAGLNPLRIAAGDTDGDGLVDVVVANHNQIRVLLNLGGEIFGPPVVTNAPVEDLVLADVLGEPGKLDVVSARWNLAWLDVRRSLPGGTLGQVHSYALEAKASDLAAGDVDGDGLLDVVTVGNSVRGSLMLGHADGSFGPYVTFGLFDANGTVDVGDLTADGLDDVVVGSSPTGLSVFLSKGDGTLVDAGVVATSFGEEVPRIGDFDGDGLGDVVLHQGFATLFVLKGHGDGSFEPPVLLADYQDLDFDPTDAVACDLDEDGDDDYVWAAGSPGGSGGTDSVGVVRGAPDLAQQTAVFYGTNERPNRLAVADFNGDGDLDVATVDESGGTISLLWGDGDGTLWPTYHTSNLPFVMQSADLDADGRMDLVVCNGNGFNGEDVHVFLGRGNARFTSATVTVPMSSLPAGLAIDDFNEDGVLDLLPISDFDFPTKTLHVLPGLGDGSFGASIDTTVDFDLASFAVGDVNNDGLPDLVGRDDNADLVRILLGRGNGKLLPYKTFDMGELGVGHLQQVVLGDFAETGGLDVIAQNNNLFGGLVQILVGLGDGTFLGPVNIVTGLRVGTLAAADLDLDGHLDLVVGEEDGPHVGVMLGQGAAAFDPTVIYDVGGIPNSVRLGDVTGDGAPDIVVADDDPLWKGTISVLVGAGDGGFLPVETFTTAANPYDTAIADFDGDGHGDIAVACGGSDGLQVLVNRRGPWDDLGLPLAGALGKPRMTGVGTLAPGGSTVEFHLHDARPSASTFLVAGTAGLFVPFKGGTMVPDPQVLLGPLPTDAAGGFDLVGTWPAAFPAGIPFHFQFWTPDPAGPAGFSASNGLRGTTP